MKKSKKWIALFLAALCTFTPLTAFAADVNNGCFPNSNQWAHHGSYALYF